MENGDFYVEEVFHKIHFNTKIEVEIRSLPVMDMNNVVKIEVSTSKSNVSGGGLGKWFRDKLN